MATNQACWIPASKSRFKNQNKQTFGGWGSNLIHVGATTCICNTELYIRLHYMFKNQRLTSNWPKTCGILPDTSTVYGELCWLTWLQNQEASGLKERLIVCVLPVTEWLVSNVDTWILIRTHRF